MEGKYRREATVFDEKAHMARHRYGARGNVITFPLPVEELLQKLAEQIGKGEEGGESVPRGGKQLADVFRVILKTNKQGKTTDEELKTLIHQGTVRRQAQHWEGRTRPFRHFASFAKLPSNWLHGLWVKRLLNMGRHSSNMVDSSANASKQNVIC